MKNYTTLIVVAVLAILIGLWVGTTGIANAPTGGKACTMEAKICLDGSSVGRTGPNCEFAPCPTSSTTTPGGAGILPYNSGIEGSVSLGPTCPVERIPPDPQCADKPYATAVTVYRASATTPFLIGSTNTLGVFKFSLPPGDYTLEAKGGATLPHCSPVSVTVTASGYVTANIACDTGIR